MAVYSPKLIATAVGKRLADLFLIGNDLRQVLYCCDRLIEEGVELKGQGRALLDSAIIRYRRCFTTGVRTNLIELVDEFTLKEQALHQLVFTMANMYVAHSINDYEQAVSTVHVAMEAGKLKRSGIGASMSHVAELSPVEVASLKGMAIKLMDKVTALRKALADDLTKYLEQLSDDQLQAFDDALGLPSGKRTYSRRRR